MASWRWLGGPVTRSKHFLLALLVLAAPQPAQAQTTTLAPPRIGGYIQVRQVAQENIGLTATLNRARVSLDGPLPSRVNYRFLVEYEAPTGARTPAAVSLREAIIRWAPGAFALTAGQFKTPFSREYLIPVPQLETPDFAAVVDSLAPKYDVGVMGEYLFGPYAVLMLGVFNGEGQNATTNRDSTVLGVGRFLVRPIAQLAVAASATHEGPDSMRVGLEAMIEALGGFGRFEYITRHRTGRARDQDDFGWYALAGLRITPRLQAVGRLEDFQRPAIGVSRRVRATTLGVNMEFSPNRVQLMLYGVRRISGAAQATADQLIGQLQVRF